MVLVNEGIDRVDIPLILEATKDFEAGLSELIKSIEGFLDAVESFKEIKSWVSPLNFTLENLKKIDTSKISDEYKFTDHAKMMSAPIPDDADDGFVPPEFTVSDAAINFPVYVNALRDSILEVAKWLEGYKELFSVGQKGIFFTEEFQGYIQNQELKVRDFGQSGTEILQLVSGVTEEEDLKLHFQDAWMKDDTTSENAQSAWDEFVGVFDKIGEGASAAHDAATAKIKAASAPAPVKKAASDGGGLLGSLLSAIVGGDSDQEDPIEPIDQNPEWIIGQSLTDDRGIFAMTFTDLQELIAKVIQLQEGAGTAAASALEKLDAHQQEVATPSKEQTKLIELLKEKFPKLETTMLASIGSALEAAGMKDGNFEGINQEKAKQSLMEVLKEEEQVKAIIDTLFETGDSEGGTEEGDPFVTSLEDKNKLSKQLKKFLQHEEYPDVDKNIDAYQKLIQKFIEDNNLTDPSVEGSIEDNTLDQDAVSTWFSSNTPDGMEGLRNALVIVNDDGFFKFFEENKAGLQEARLILRWGRLAGIIKG